MNELNRFYQYGWELTWKEGIDNKFRNRIYDVKKFIRDKRFKDISFLDIGCGIGTFFRSIQEEYPQCIYHGLDISKMQIEYLKSVKLEKRYKFIVADADDFDMDMKYDYILCLEVLEHIPNPDNVIQNIIKHSHKHTKFVFSVPIYHGNENKSWWWNKYFYKGKWNETLNPVKLYDKLYRMYHKRYKDYEIKEYLENKGFIVKDFTYCNAKFNIKILDFLFNKINIYLIDKIFNLITRNRFAGNMTIICKRINKWE